MRRREYVIQIGGYVLELITMILFYVGLAIIWSCVACALAVGYVHFFG